MEKAWKNLGVSAHRRGDIAQAQTWLEQGLALAQELDNAWLLGLVHLNLGGLALNTGAYQTAQHHLTMSMTYHQASGQETAMIEPLTGLGRLANKQGDYVQSRQHFQRTLTLSQSTWNHEWAMKGVWEFACALVRANCPCETAQLFGCIKGEQERRRMPLAPIVLPRYHALLDQLRGQLDPTAFDAAWAEGRIMTLDQALALRVLEDAH